MTKSWAGLALAGVLLGCDGGAAPAPKGGAGGKDGGLGSAADAGSEPFVRITLTDRTPTGGLKLAWVAFQDGDGAWQPVEAAGRDYTFRILQPRFGLAMVCEAPGGSVSGEVIHATAAELPALSLNCGEGPPAASHKVSGKFSGMVGGNSFQVQAASADVTYLVGQVSPPGDTYDGLLPPGTYDLAAIALMGGKPRWAALRREVMVAGTTVVDFTFDAASALVEQPLMLPGDSAAAPGLTASIRLFTGRGVVQLDHPPEPQPKSYLAFPAALMRMGETQELEVLSVAGQMPRFNLRGTVRGFREARPLEVKVPPEFASARVTAAATTPTLRPRMTFDAYPGALYYQLSVGQVAADRVTSWLAIFSAGWLDGKTSYDFPDFSGAPGFQEGYLFQPQPQQLDYACDAVTSTRDFWRTINADPASRDGAQMTYARKTDRGPIR
jgi:hypothetical protein